MNRTQQITLWSPVNDASYQASAVAGPVLLNQAEPVPIVSQPLAPGDVLLQPMEAAGDAVAALIVGHEAGLWVAVDGTPLSAGTRLLRHAERIDVNGRAYWVSAETTIVSTQYDPVVHGDDEYCFLTKARLAPGQEITICPGVPGTPCSAIYKAEAWQLAMQSGPAFKCPRCGYRPDGEKWRPPEPKAKRSLDGILQLLRD